MTGRSKIPRYSDTDLRKEGFNVVLQIFQDVGW
jgi:hypothetical protein